MLLRIDHETRLTYSAPVHESVFELRMGPRSDEDQTLLGYRVRTTPHAPATIYRDGFGNRVELLNLLGPCREVLVQTTSIVRPHRRPGTARLASVKFPAGPPEDLEAMEWLRPSPLADHCPALEDFVASLPAPRGNLASTLEDLLGAVRRRLKYEKKVTTAQTPLSEALMLGRGVCQDFAHLFLGVCRRLGLPARYASGYVNQPGEIATHAWCQIWGDGAGWVDVDPTFGRFVGDDHVVIALGRDYGDVPPNRGTWKGLAEEAITVTVKVQPLEKVPPDWGELSGLATWSSGIATPRPTPYNGHQPAGGGRTGFRQQQSQQQQ